MEKELASKIFLQEDYSSKKNMEEHIKEYINKLKESFPLAIITREFYKGNGILIRATQIENNYIKKVKDQKEIKLDNEQEKEFERIKERGINGVGENVVKEISNGKSRERGLHNSRENGRERGGR